LARYLYVVKVTEAFSAAIFKDIVMNKVRKIFSIMGAGLTALRRYTAHVLTLAILLVVVSAIFSKDKLPEVPESGFLVLRPVGTLVEMKTELDPVDAVLNQLMGASSSGQESVYELIKIIEHAKTDDRITGMYLNLRRFSGGALNNMQLLADAIADFRESGKPVYTAADYYSQSQYLLASQANEVWIHPLGGLILDGFRSEQPYLKGLLDKLKVKVNIFRVGDFKSAVEPYLLSEMSPEARENMEGWMGERWQQYLATVQRHRDIDASMIGGESVAFFEALAAANYDNAQLALNTGLAEAMKHRHEVVARLIELAGGDAEKGEFNHVTHGDYWQTLPESVRNANADLGKEKNHIAIIMARGVIVDGQGGSGEIGGDRLASELRKARFDDKVKAVVLRIDSPGGSAFASEIIRQELLQLRAAGKPVIASMSGVAASGGYWIAAGADSIVAEPSTITGSIGVFAMIPTIDETLAEIGVNFDGVGTTDLPEVSLTKPISESAGRYLQASVDLIYEDFLDLVGSARGMARDSVHAVAQGQVWSGERALALGLVDELGDLQLAIQRAASAAELEQYAVRWPERELSKLQQLLAQLGMQSQVAASSSVSVEQLRNLLAPHVFLRQFNDPRAIYVRCLECEVN
jgi:protease-4